MSLARDVTTVGTATLLSRLLGFFRDVGIAAVLGAGVLSDAYFAALQIPNLFRRLLAEGALNSAFVPMWLRIRDEAGSSATRRFGEGTLGLLAATLAIVAVLCLLFAPAVVHLIAPGFRDPGDRFPLAVVFVRLSAPYVALAGVVAVAAAILNAEGRVAAAAFGLVIFNCVLLAAVLLVVVRGATHSSSAGEILSIAIVLAGIGQLVLVGAALLRLPTRPRRLSLKPSGEVRRFFRQAVPGVVAGGIPQLKLMAGAMVASSSPAAVSWLYYANRLYELPLGVVSIAIATVMVPLIAASVRTRSAGEIAAAQSRALEIAVGLALPSAVAFATLADPIAGGLFERGAFGPHDTAMVAAALAAISAGLPGHVIEKVLGAVSFAHEDTKTPMIAALCGLASTIVGSLVLFPIHGHVGIAAAIAASGWVGATLLGLTLWRRGWLSIDRASRHRLPLIVLATMLMGAVILGGYITLAHWFDVTGSAPARLSTLAVLVVAGLAVYLVALETLGAVRLSDLVAAVRHRL
jgi:putative peptidoglycan lipid II flippase